MGLGRRHGVRGLPRLPLLAGALAVAVALVAIGVVGLSGESSRRSLVAWPAGPATRGVERAAARSLEAGDPLVGASARDTFCAVELSAGERAPGTAGVSVRAYGWATCQQLVAAGAAQLRGGTQSSEPILVSFRRSGGGVTIDEIARAAPGLSYEDDMRRIFPPAARQLVDRISPARFDARIDRLLCENLAAARVRLGRPGATLVQQGERCPAGDG